VVTPPLLLTIFDALVFAVVVVPFLLLIRHRGAVPKLPRLTGTPPLPPLSVVVPARDEAHKDALLKREFNANAKVDVGRFKGLGEMMPAQLKETTMDPAKRTLLRVVLLTEDREGTADSVERLMGTRADARFAFISDKAEFASEDLLDV
jgi:topoisomerase-4 subunit B